LAYRVDISPAALDDAERAHQWLASRCGGYAIVWSGALLEAISSLETFPTRCPLVPESRLANRGLRQLVVGSGSSTFRIIFRLTHDEQAGHDIVRIWNTSRRALNVRDLSPG
jgi:hypothetical protein